MKDAGETPAPHSSTATAYLALVRPGILAMVLAAMLAAAWTAAEGSPDWPAVLHALLGTAAVIAGAVALNQRLELASDAKMPRTAGRPLPAGRLTDRQVAWFGFAASTAGLVYLAVFSTAGLVLLTAVSWMLYVWTYTPLKSRSAWQTPVGAVAGAMPVLLGAAAVGAPARPIALVLFGIVFFWQFPHAMAIAWLYRDEFAKAQLRVASVTDPSGRTAGLLAVLGAAGLVSLGFFLPLVASVGWGIAAMIIALGAGYLACASVFARRPTNPSARRLLRASLVCLPAMLIVLSLAR